jgi:hypothetical protein
MAVSAVTAVTVSTDGVGVEEEEDAPPPLRVRSNRLAVASRE